MSRDGVTNVSLGGQLSEAYRFGCWLTGSVMIAVAVLSSIRGAKSAQHSDVARHAA
jgi:hypothetical protein